MCGIVGVVSACNNGFSQKEIAMFGQLLFLDTIRGYDSTGVFGVHNNTNAVIHKDALHGLDFLGTQEFRGFKQEMISTGKFAVGHNRAATRGTVVDTNAHPFWVDDKIVLVQNGTYKGSHKHLKDVEVDTEAVAHVIAETPSVAEALQKINASYALVWYNADEGSLNLIRNNERPLWIAKFHGTGLVFASEPIMIQYAAAREDVKIDKPEEIPAHTHVVLTLDKKGGYTRTDTAIDATYRFPKGSSRQVEEWDNLYFPGTRHNRHAVAYPTTQRGSGKNDIKATFVENISRFSPEFAFATQAEAIANMDAVNSAAFQGYHYVEMLDYVAANNHADCTAWHVYGSILGNDAGEETKDKAATLVHWIVYDKAEHEIIDMVVNCFYKVKLSTIISRQINYGQGAHKWLNTTYATSHEALEGIPQ